MNDSTEQALAEFFDRLGFPIISMEKLRAAQGGWGKVPDSYIVPRYEHPTFADSPGFAQALIVDRGTSYILDVLHQSGAGSTDEKAAAAWLETLKSPIANRIELFSGDFWTAKERGQAVVLWLKGQAAATQTGTPRGHRVEAMLQEWAVSQGKKLYVAATKSERDAIIRQLFPREAA
jgi:hypothetical protein